MAPTGRRVALLNAALVLVADHDLAAGTVAARVAASARGSIYAVISAGLGAFDGPLHGGATTLAQEFLYRILPRRIGQEVVLLNNVDLAAILAEYNRENSLAWTWQGTLPDSHQWVIDAKAQANFGD